MSAPISGQLCGMQCEIFKIGQKLKFDLGVGFLWNNELLLNYEIGQVCLILSGFAIVSTMKEDNK
jgi:hypothetical protein